MRVAAAILILALAACGRSEQAAYPPQIEMNFRNACEAQSPPAGFCACVWRRIEAEVPAADFAAFERLPMNEREGHPFTDQLREYAQSCQPEEPDQASTEPTPAP